MANLIAKGYCTHDQFGDFRIPVSFMNAVYRDFCRSQEYRFALSINEIIGASGCPNLTSFLIEQTQKRQIDILLIPSFDCIPENSASRILSLAKSADIRIFSIFEKANFCEEGLAARRSIDRNSIQ